MTEDQQKRLRDILEQMRKIVDPGDYGLGSEKESHPDDPKKAWEQLGALLDEATDLCTVRRFAVAVVVHGSMLAEGMPLTEDNLYKWLHELPQHADDCCVHIQINGIKEI